MNAPGNWYQPDQFLDGLAGFSFKGSESAFRQWVLENHPESAVIEPGQNIAILTPSLIDQKMIHQTIKRGLFYHRKTGDDSGYWYVHDTKLQMCYYFRYSR